MRTREPKKASEAVLCVTKLINTASGVDNTRYGTGFIYRDANAELWLVSNWHVFTGRRPDDPGHLLGNAAQSPFALAFGLQRKNSPTVETIECPLYRDALPLWKQHPEGAKFDIAALPITIEAGFELTCIQEAARPQAGPIEPGFDLIVVSYPFPASSDVPFPLWKRAMLASEPALQFFGNPQILIDTPGTPGMSGAPVFVSHDAFIETAEAKEAQARVDRGESSFLDEPELYDFSREKKTVELEWVGIYAGATEDRALDRLQLGRMYSSRAVDDVITSGVAGHNPFPPNEL